jgi:membrane-bound lytic murein transglycosylase B
VIGAGPARIASQLTSAERALGQGGTPAAVLTRQALIVQLACLRLTTHPGWAAAVVRKVAPAQRAAAATAIAAAAELIALTPPQPRLPPWRIITARPLAELRADYHAAQAATGVGWSYLAAINLVETDFGRIVGPSTAGAQGPMQFLPATWASYGHGSIRSPRSAILAAARFLLAHHASTSIAAALYAYNPSSQYVDAVLRYARQIRASPHALTGYYHSQILYHLRGGWVLLPPGYGTSRTVRPVPVRR